MSVHPSPEPTPDVLVVVHPDKQSIADAAAARLVATLSDALAARPVAHVALTGGSLGSTVVESLVNVPGRSAVDWSRVHVWWGDERYLPAGDPDRNDRQADDAGLGALGLDPANIHRVPGPDTSDSAEAAAEAYGEQLRRHGSGAWDVVFLGVGPDGHIASLFPHHEAQRITDAIAVAVHDSPKPPPTRVSLTYECFERTREVWFIVAGADKADAVRAALAPDADPWDVPASVPRGVDATRWLVDTDAASRL